MLHHDDRVGPARYGRASHDLHGFPRVHFTGKYFTRAQSTTGWVSWLVQQMVAMLLDDPGAERWRAAARRCYAERRTALREALDDHGIEVRGTSGYNVWVPVSHEASTVQALLAVGWAVRAGEVFRVESPPGLRVTVAELAPERAGRLAGDLAAALAAPRRNISA